MPPPIRGNVVGFRVKKKDPIVRLGPLKKAATYFPTDVVSSAQTGLTSLFGMVRGEPRRYNHLGFRLPSVYPDNKPLVYDQRNILTYRVKNRKKTVQKVDNHIKECALPPEGGRDPDCYRGT